MWTCGFIISLIFLSCQTGAPNLEKPGAMEGAYSWNQSSNHKGEAGSRKEIIQQLFTSAIPMEPGNSSIYYPANGSLFPPNFTAPTFRWEDSVPTVNLWLLTFSFDGMGDTLHVVTEVKPPPELKIDSACISNTNELPVADKNPRYKPESELWKLINHASSGRIAHLRITGFNRSDISKPLSSARVEFTTSVDPVDAPIFYRDVPLMPTKNATGNIMPLALTSMELINWRLRDVSLPSSKVVMNKLPTCANCHSFSQDGNKVGMDVQGPNLDKGGYALAPITKNTSLGKKDVISWNYDFPEKPKGAKTIGFLSRISPDGKHVLSTLNEQVYVINYEDYRFLQVFFPTRGVLGFYSEEKDTIQLLPGADDSNYVHCDPVWSPDGKMIVFARARAIKPFQPDQATPAKAGDPEETQIQYDLYQMPFNNGRGGKATPIAGASQNGMSNTFPKVSPDGKWLVFVKCKNGQLMRPDSRLWIVPLAGGEAREMKCNTTRMNSWHSFSPNGRWMVFSSKANTHYTQMFLTHIDANGIDSPPILIPNSTADNRASNLPEFINRPYAELESIKIPAIDYYRYMLLATKANDKGDPKSAIEFLKRAVKETDREYRFKVDALINLSGLVSNKDSAISFARQAADLKPDYSLAHENLGLLLHTNQDEPGAVKAYYQALETDPKNAKAMVRLGRLFYKTSDTRLYNPKKAVALLEAANELSGFRKISVLESLAGAYSNQGEFKLAVSTADRALHLAIEQNLGKQKKYIAWQREKYLKKIPFKEFAQKSGNR